MPTRRNRFTDLLKSITDVKILTAHDAVSFNLDSCERLADKNTDVKVVHLGLENMSRGLRPVGVPDRAHRVRVGQDSSIADLVCALHLQAQYDCVCFDFGGTWCDMCVEDTRGRWCWI